MRLYRDTIETLYSDYLMDHYKSGILSRPMGIEAFKRKHDILEIQSPAEAMRELFEAVCLELRIGRLANWLKDRLG